MFTPNELKTIGFSLDSETLSMLQSLFSQAGEKSIQREEVSIHLHAIIATPEKLMEHPLYGPLASHVQQTATKPFVLRKDPVPWQQWGEINIDDSAIEQMENACRLPIAIRGALMPDAHTGYGLPIGGVLAVDNAVIPYAVGVDIACRMRLSILDLSPKCLKDKRAELVAALEKETRFGVGASFKAGERRWHAVLDEDWDISPVTNANKDLAWSQLGSSGSGNHFVEFGELHCETAVTIGNVALDKGIYLALLSHSGSRGTGEKVADYYSKRAMELHPELPREVQHLAWFSLDSGYGQEYWAAMHLMGKYSAATHEVIHHHILEAIGAEAMTMVENHHNFAWQETLDNRAVIIHRKGATPAAQGVEGVVPGSMGSPGFVISGKGNPASLYSCSHGAGRLMSRSAALRLFTEGDVHSYLEKRGIELLSGGLDEAPMAYKDIFSVMAAQEDLVSVLARFDPKIVKMAPSRNRYTSRNRRKRRKKR